MLDCPRKAYTVTPAAPLVVRSRRNGAGPPPRDDGWGMEPVPLLGSALEHVLRDIFQRAARIIVGQRGEGGDGAVAEVAGNAIALVEDVGAADHCDGFSDVLSLGLLRAERALDRIVARIPLHQEQRR